MGGRSSGEEGVLAMMLQVVSALKATGEDGV